MFFLTGLVKDMIKLFFWYPLRWVIPLFPLKSVHFIGNLGGAVYWKLAKRMCEVMYDELSIIFNGKFTEPEKRTIIKSALKIIAKNQLEFLLFRSLNRQKANRMITIEGLSKLDDALSRKRGVILLIAHFGANKLVMPALGYNGYKINQVAGKATEWIEIIGKELSYLSKKVFELEHENERFLPVNFIYVFKSMKPIIKCLKNNEIVCFAIDGGGGTKKEKVRFLGRTANISTGPFRAAQKTGATVLPAFVVRQPNDRHRLIIENYIKAGSSSDEVEGIIYSLKKFLRVLERYIEQYPSHYAFRLYRARMLCQKDSTPLFTDYESRRHQ